MTTDTAPWLSPLALPPSHQEVEPDSTADEGPIPEMPDDYHEDAMVGSGGPPVTDDERDMRDLLRIKIRGAAKRAQVDGATFLLDKPDEIDAIWGKGHDILWAAGEWTLLNGPTGVGKSTIAQQVVLASLGLRPDVLGLPVRRCRRVLYIAADRPPQIARSFARIVTEADRPALADRLVVWRGALPADIAKEPEIVAELADEYHADRVVIDSLKDVAAKLSDEEVGQRVNQALQLACLGGVEVLALHHQRKRQQGGGKPKTLDDVFGSTWLTAGAGSVLLVWGEAGDAVVELSHLKQPADAVGPLTILHDHDAGVTTVQGQVDLLDVVRMSNGITVEGAARALEGNDSPDRNALERARRKLDRLVDAGHVHKQPGTSGGHGGKTAARYWPTDNLRAIS